MSDQATDWERAGAEIEAAEAHLLHALNGGDEADVSDAEEELASVLAAAQEVRCGRGRGAVGANRQTSSRKPVLASRLSSAGRHSGGRRRHVS